jgi:hypothetical protein
METTPKYERASVLRHNPDALFADGFDEALVGAGSVKGVWVALYDNQKCIDILQDRDGMDYWGAVEFFSDNVEGVYYGVNTPLFLDIHDEEEDV